jgi:hypothetical protein
MLGAGMMRLLWPQAIYMDLTMQGIIQLCQFIISESMNTVLPKYLQKPPGFVFQVSTYFFFKKKVSIYLINLLLGLSTHGCDFVNFTTKLNGI